MSPYKLFGIAHFKKTKMHRYIKGRKINSVTQLDENLICSNVYPTGMYKVTSFNDRKV